MGAEEHASAIVLSAPSFCKECTDLDSAEYGMVYCTTRLSEGVPDSYKLGLARERVVERIEKPLSILLMAFRGEYKSRGYGTVVTEPRDKLQATLNAGK